MHPRVRIMLIGTMLTPIVFVLSQCMGISLYDAQGQKLLGLWFLIGMPAVAIPIHLLSDFEVNYERYVRGARSQEAGARSHQLTIGEGGLFSLKHDPNIVSAYVNSAFQEQYTRTQFFFHALRMGLCSLLFSWLILTSAYFDKKP